MDILEHTKSITGCLPLYVKHLSCYHSETKNTEIVNGTSYTLLVPTPTRTLRPVTYVWANETDGISSHIKIYSVQVNQQIALKDLGTTVLSSCCARSIVYVPGTSGGVAQSNSDNPLRTDLVWIATDDKVWDCPGYSSFPLFYVFSKIDSCKFYGIFQLRQIQSTSI